MDFNLFISCLRFPIACYQLVIWLLDELQLCMDETMNTSSKSVTMGNSPKKSSELNNQPAATCAVSSYQQLPIRVVELRRIKVHLQK